MYYYDIWHQVTIIIYYHINNILLKKILFYNLAYFLFLSVDRLESFRADSRKKIPSEQ